MRHATSLHLTRVLSQSALACALLLTASCGGDSTAEDTGMPGDGTGFGGSGGSAGSGQGGSAGKGGKAGASGASAGTGGSAGGKAGSSGSSMAGSGGSGQSGSGGSAQGGKGGTSQGGTGGSTGGSSGSAQAGSGGASGQQGGSAGAAGQSGQAGSGGSSGNQGGSAGASGEGGSAGASGNQGGSAGSTGGSAGQSGQAGSGGAPPECTTDVDCAGKPSGSSCCGGTCVDTQTDAAHCGTCDTACAPHPNTVLSCTTGACTYACAQGFSDCDGDPSNGCELQGSCTCKPGETSPCYEGPVGTEGVGVCKGGTKACKADGTGYDACTGQVLPSKEICDGTQTDENCNGQVNEAGEDPSCVCTPSSAAPCYSGPSGTQGVGVCKAGVKTCQPDGTGYGACEGEVVPGPEVCAPGNTTDENCDGQVNEGGAGSQGCVCAPGSFTPCYDGQGGLQSPELSAPSGICVAGVKTCNADGATYGACEGQILPAAEVCDGTLTDENCNGQVNEGGQGCQCAPGATQGCWDGPASAVFGGTSICKKGSQTCTAQGTWGPCQGQVLPSVEPAGMCTANIDEDCNGDPLGPGAVDADSDGWTPCQGDCCDIPSQCGTPSLVNPGAYDVAGNALDDDCDGTADNAVTSCDGALASNSSNALDYAKAIDLCQFTTESPAIEQKKWGVISATLTLADGTGSPNALSRSIRPGFGSSILPKKGSRLAVLSTGNAADSNDTNPPYASFQGGQNMGKTSAAPADFFKANGNKLPNAPGCPAPAGAQAIDPVMLKIRVRVPTNAQSFTFNSYFLSSEYPEWVCSPYNDFFVTLLDSGFKGTPANPADKNLAFFDPAPAGPPFYPVGVNLASGNTGLFRACKNGTIGCASGSVMGTINTCTSTAELVGTGMDILNPGPKYAGDPGYCGSNNQLGGGTTYLTSAGNVTPGETIEVRFAIWDTSDPWYDSVVLLDNFTWSLNASQPGTVIIQ